MEPGGAGAQAQVSRRRFACVAGSVLALSLGSGAATADAHVTIGPAEIVVEAPAASAVIQRDPFSISFRDGEGRTVLSETPAGAEPLTLSGEAGGSVGQPSSPGLYAPLAFLVGSDLPVAFESRPEDTIREEGDVGNLESNPETGIEYSAQRVLEAREQGAGVSLVLATDDPSGRTLTVTVTPRGSAAIAVHAVPSDPAGVAAFADSFLSRSGEAFHGFGGRHDSLDQHGHQFANWVDQENVDEDTGTPPDPASTELVPNGPEAAYYVQSSFVSNEGYGFLLDRSELSRWRLGTERADAWQVEVDAPAIDYVVAPGSMKTTIGTLTGLGGRQPVPPRWALGPLVDRGVELLPSARAYEEQVQSDIREMTAHKVLPTAYRIEGYGFVDPAFLEHAIAQLKALGVRPLLYFRPFVGTEPIGTEYPTEYAAAVEHGYVATDAEGAPYIFRDNFGGSPAAVIDLTNPAAVGWWKQRIDRGLDLGAEGFMLDFGEQVLPGMHFHDGSTGVQMHNEYPVLVQRVTRQIVQEYEALHPGREIVFFTRSGYSGVEGSTGSAAYENFNFPGDETTDWSHASGIASLTPDMLNRAVGGAYGYGTDIGGYYDLYAPSTSRELFARWAEWAALSTVFRVHGAIRTKHLPWSPGINSNGLWRQLSALHTSAEPLILSLWKEAESTGIPPTRPLYLEYPEDPVAAGQEQEWLLGPDVLVAPVVERRARARQVYFPAGCWRDPETGLEVNGPLEAAVPAAKNQLPFFFRCGTAPFVPPGRFGRALGSARSRTRRSGVRRSRGADLLHH